jgi:glycosyltransferase involved in cell wall biosynthesis
VCEWGRRRYCLQISRFDPSKGLIDVLEAYCLLRVRLAQAQEERRPSSGLLEPGGGDAAALGSAHLRGNPALAPPFLVIAGVGSIDDPEGSRVFDECHAHVAQNARFAPWARDIVILKLPPCDQLLNALLTRARIYMQLSVREGFEIKVQEAVRKGVPVVAYASGGITQQVQEGRTGFLLPPGDREGVAERLHHLLTDEQAWSAMRANSLHGCRENLALPYQTASWLALAQALLPRDGAGEERREEGRSCGPLQPDAYAGEARTLDSLWRSQAAAEAEEGADFETYSSGGSQPAR